MPPSELPMSCMYSHRMNGLGGSFSRYSLTLSGAVYMWLYMSEMRSLYAGQLNTPS